MKRKLMVLSILAAILFVGTFNWTGCTAKKAADTSTEKAATETERPSPPPFIAAIQEKIKGKEDLPAEEVFDNIDILKGMPAKRVLPIMQMAFSKSLGVKCNHCHSIDDLASEIKPAKEIAREMWRMTRRINQELLTDIDNLQGPQPIVNCTTCHRGDIKPALRME